MGNPPCLVGFVTAPQIPEAICGKYFRGKKMPVIVKPDFVFAYQQQDDLLNVGNPLLHPPSMANRGRCGTV